MAKFPSLGKGAQLNQVDADRSTRPAPGILRELQLLLTQWRGDETEAGVELRRILIDRRSQHRPDAGLLGDEQGASDGILQQTGADASPVVLVGYGQPCLDRRGGFSRPP